MHNADNFVLAKRINEAKCRQENIIESIIGFNSNEVQLLGMRPVEVS